MMIWSNMYTGPNSVSKNPGLVTNEVKIGVIIPPALNIISDVQSVLRHTISPAIDISQWISYFITNILKALASITP